MPRTGNEVGTLCWLLLLTTMLWALESTVIWFCSPSKTSISHTASGSRTSNITKPQLQPRMSPVNDWPIPGDLIGKIYVDISCNTDDKRDKVLDALCHLPTLVENGADKASELVDVWHQGYVKARNNARGGERALMAVCPVWTGLFGKTTGMTLKLMFKWRNDWRKTAEILRPGGAWANNARALITCHDSIGDTGGVGRGFHLRNECNGRTEAISIWPKRARVPRVTGAKLSYEKNNIWVINLCPLFFALPSLSENTEAFEKKREAAIFSGKRNPIIPNFQAVNTGARVLLHEIFHMDWLAGWWAKEADEDMTGLQNIRAWAADRGFTFMQDKPDPNAYFAFWGHYAGLSHTEGCNMWK